MNRILSLHLPHGALHGKLELPMAAHGLILLARSHHVAVDDAITANLAARGYAIFAMDILTAQELHFADATQNVPRLAERLLEMLDLIKREPDIADLPLAIFANGDVTPAVIRAAAQRNAQVSVLACHNGLVDRAGVQALELLEAPLLMLFDPDETVATQAYQRAERHIQVVHEMHVLRPGEDPVLRVVAWLGLHL